MCSKLITSKCISYRDNLCEDHNLYLPILILYWYKRSTDKWRTASCTFEEKELHFYFFSFIDLSEIHVLYERRLLHL